MSTAASSFVRAELIAPIAPPPTRVGALAWAKEHLFGSLGNAILTLLSILTLAAVLWPTISATPFQKTRMPAPRASRCRFAHSARPIVASTPMPSAAAT